MNIKIWRQYIDPHHCFSRAMAWFTTRSWPWLKNWQIRQFIRKYAVNMSEAQYSDAAAYVTFTDFFTRHLKENARHFVRDKKTVISPADACIAQIGSMTEGVLIQAKGRAFSVEALLGGDSISAHDFQNGFFATLYLAPKDYHRVHMPLSGLLKKMIYIPGDLFSVNLHTADHVPNLFARNERVVCLFETDAGPMAMVLVGAMFVASIVTTWAGVVTPARRRQVQVTSYDQPIVLHQGDEMGYFNFGSTVIVLFGPQAIAWENCVPNQTVRMGQVLAQNVRYSPLAHPAIA